MKPQNPSPERYPVLSFIGPGQDLVLNDRQSQNFWSKVEKNGPLPDQTNPHYEGLNKCWQWTGGIDEKGYGLFGLNGKTKKVHRLSWLLLFPKPSKRICILHRCDNPACLNPSHLFLGTHTDNMRDKINKGRANMQIGSDHWSARRPERIKRGEGHGMSKISELDVIRILDLIRSGYSNVSVSREFMVSPDLISKIRHGKLWKHLLK